VTLVDWGSLTPAAVAPLYRRERRRWLEALSWDTATAWTTIESARVSWGLPGFVCHDRTGEVSGWTYFMKHEGCVDVGGIVADNEAATGAVIDGLAAAGSSVSGFVYATAPGLAESLARHGVHTERYAYLMRTTEASVDESSPDEPANAHWRLRSWRVEDVAHTASLLQAAYGTAGQLFARNNRMDEWTGYVQTLVAHSGCGVLLPQLSTVIEGHAAIGGVALVTALSPDTAHLAQLAVTPSLRRAGVGRHLVREIIASARRAGYRRLSLLVSMQNLPACALYHSFAFARAGEFLALK
jgi:ribosomal protein S18 acetylase RimI-like enzyme